MNQDFLDILHALSDAEVRFLVVGAYAVGVHGHPRATGDLDLWVEASPENAPRIWKALRAFQIRCIRSARASLLLPGSCFRSEWRREGSTS